MFLTSYNPSLIFIFLCFKPLPNNKERILLTLETMAAGDYLGLLLQKP